jgi:hypothetical protein
MGGTGTKSGPDISANPFYHQYSCVSIGGNVTCGGQDAVKAPYSEGKASEGDEYNPETCQVRDSNECFEKCLIESWKKPRPWYGLIGPGTNCQEYDDKLNKDCWSKCK